VGNGGEFVSNAAFCHWMVVYCIFAFFEETSKVGVSK